MNKEGLRGIKFGYGRDTPDPRRAQQIEIAAARLPEASVCGAKCQSLPSALPVGTSASCQSTPSLLHLRVCVPSQFFLLTDHHEPFSPNFHVPRVLLRRLPHIPTSSHVCFDHGAPYLYG